MAQYVELVSAATTHFGNVRCVAFDGSIVHLARAEGMDVLVRTAHTETAIELAMAALKQVSRATDVLCVSRLGDVDDLVQYRAQIGRSGGD